ncbi:MAG: glycosyltransferase [Lachnospiraceae bacterium]|nr:glycosyltransferase [Lachnospiraceae bacterium]
MKKVLFVSKALWIGGIETALVNMLNRIDYNSYDVTCLILNNYTEMADRITGNCKLIVADRHDTVSFESKYKYSKVYNLKTVPSGAGILRRFAGWITRRFAWFENACYARYIHDNLDNTEYDIVIAFCGDACEVAANSVYSSKLFSFYHYGDMRRVYHDYLGYKKSEKIFAVSDILAGQLKEYMPEYANKIEALPNITDINYIRKQAEETCEIVRYNDTILMSCGRIVDDKGFDIAAEACRILVDQGYNIRWYIVGDGPEREELEKKIVSLRLQKYFILVGMQSNPYKYMKKCDLYVQPSRNEAYGLTIREAMIIGKPIITTKTPGGLQLVRDGFNGNLCDTTPDSIANTIAEHLNNNDITDRMMENIKQLDFDKSNREVMEKLYHYFE